MEQGPGLKAEAQTKLGEVLKKSVTEGTLKGYGPGWRDWQEYLRSDAVEGAFDPYLRGVSIVGKVMLLAGFFLARYEMGKREKGAHGAGGAVRKFFVLEREDTAWMDDAIVSASRTACRRTAAENREHVKKGRGKSRLPVWQGLLETIREHWWVDQPMTTAGLDSMMTYVTAMYAFDIAARGGEAAHTGSKREDHTIMAEEVLFYLSKEVLVGKELVDRLRGGTQALREMVSVEEVLACEVQAVHQKTGLIHTTKTIGRRSEEEAQLLEDLFKWVVVSGITCGDNSFCRNACDKRSKVWRNKKCTSQMVVSAIKKTVQAEGLDPARFSFHSIRIGAITQLQACQVPIAEVRARGNYTKESDVPTHQYNYASKGMGPLAANAKNRALVPTKEDVAKLMPVVYESVNK